jgi:alpha-1,2-mannosyltransferase
MGVPGSPDQLNAWQKLGLYLLIPLILGFGVVVEIRGAFLQHRWTDLTVFLRAAWAVQYGEDLYQAADAKGLHYHYPPLLAIVLLPFADSADGAGAVPFAVSVGLWYVLSVVCMALGIHALARALEHECPVLRQRSRPGNAVWWGLRVWPVLACLPLIGFALSLGQVNTIWLALVCCMAAALVRGRSGQAGLWLAGAICLKVLPVFLLIYPLWRRDFRCLASCAAGLGLGLLVVPSLVLGPERTVAYGQEWSEVVLLPAFGFGSDRSRDEELLHVTATQNQGLLTVFHNTMYINQDPRPAQVAPAVRLAATSIGGLLTALTLLAAGWRRNGPRRNEALFIGGLSVIMLLLAPTGHPHYLILLVPLMMGLLAHQWGQGPTAQPDRTLRWLLGVNFSVSALPLLLESSLLFHLGFPMYAAILFWLGGMLMLQRVQWAKFSFAAAPIAENSAPATDPREQRSAA